MQPAIDRASLTSAQRDVLADALRVYLNRQRARQVAAVGAGTRDDATWRRFVAAELLEMFV